VTPATVLEARAYDPFCAVSVLGAIHRLADASHSKDLSDLVSAGKWKAELLATLGKVAPPRYANFIGRYRDDPDFEVRRAVASALGLIDNEAIAVPVLVHVLARNDRRESFFVQWDAGQSLIAVAKRKSPDGVRRRVVELFQEPYGMTVAIAARALAATGDARGFAKLRELTGHADPDVRREAVLALGELRDRGGADLVTRRLSDDNVAVRGAAVYALARIKGAAVIPELRTGVLGALAYERDRRRDAGEKPEALERLGIGVFDLRETLQEAITETQSKG
jgi:HEAT repeat protein